MICATLSVIVGLLPFAGLMLLQALYKHAGIYESASHGGILYWTAVVLGLAGGLFVFGLLFRRLVVGAVRMALEEFAWFDRLADDEFTPRLRETLPWAIMLDPTARR
jgi:hypothetical protein